MTHVTRVPVLVRTFTELIWSGGQRRPVCTVRTHTYTHTRTRVGRTESSGGSQREKERERERDRENRETESVSPEGAPESWSLFLRRSRVRVFLSLDFVPARLCIRSFCSPDNGLIFAGAVHPGGSNGTRLSLEQEHAARSTQHSGSSTRR